MPARPAALVVAALALLLLLVAHVGDARAHASLVKAEPADGAVVPAAPAALRLRFNEPVSPLAVRLIGPDGEGIALPAVAAENDTVTIPAPAALRRGTHVLSFRVISADGHPVGGAVMFSIGAPSAPPAPAAQSAGGVRLRAAIWAAKAVLYVGLFVGVGGAFFCAWIGDVCPRAWLLTALIAGLVAAPLSVGLQGLDALDLPLSALAQGAAWQAGLATAYGATAFVAAAALLAGIGGIAATARHPLIKRGCALVGFLGVGLALALSGHAATAEPRLVSRPAVFVHAVCVAFWIGALLPLYASRRAAPQDDAALNRFSRVIPLPLALLIAAGGWLAFAQLERTDALWTTRYGEVLALKLAAVLALLALAAANRYRFVPRLRAKGVSRPLVLALGGELAIALLILGLVALWRFTPPPRALAIAAPVAVHLHGEKAMVEIERDRAPGKGATLLVLDGAFQPLAAKEVTLVLADPAAGIEPMRRVAVRSGESDNLWRIEDLRIPLAGRWTVRVEILVGDFDKLTVEDTVALDSSE